MASKSKSKATDKSGRRPRRPPTPPEGTEVILGPSEAAAALATLAGDDMSTLDAAATLESAADLLGDAIAACRLVDLAARLGGELPRPAVDFARSVVRRADDAGAGRQNGENR
jgi:hypothetical protein